MVSRFYSFILLVDWIVDFFFFASFLKSILVYEYSSNSLYFHTHTQTAYATQGQKCSAQSIMFVHDNWKEAGFLEKIKANAAKRSLDDLTIGKSLKQTFFRL